jgi:LPS sulfotransferase NodH
MKRPVFVLGSPRSGTTLLYHMLLSAGGFAVYRSESKVFDLIAPRCGSLRAAKNKEKMLDLWFQTRMFGVSEVDPEKFRAEVMSDCHTAGDFLRIFMEYISRAQNVDRWAECTPEHLLYVPWIKRELPDAQFIHIIRDGRDVALSLQKQGWVQPFPWDKDRGLIVAGIFWEWIVGKGREFGRALGADYVEVRYEDLMADPRSTLARLGQFINHDLDYDRIQQVAIGSVNEPNTSFTSEVQKGGFQPVGRWRNSFSSGDLAAFEGAIGPFLKESGYTLEATEKPGNAGALKRMRALYRAYWDSKLSIKVKTPLGRFFMTSAPSEL